METLKEQTPKVKKKMRLSSAQIRVLEALAKYPNAAIMETNHNDLQEVRDGSVTVLYFKGQTLDFLIRKSIVVPAESAPFFVINPKLTLTTFWRS